MTAARGTARYEEPQFLPWDGRRVPITFVGGYLGAGKTTAINDVLRQADRPIAVIVNEVGSIDVDAALVRRRHGDTIELIDGCICCSSIDGLGAAFDQIRARPVPPDHVIVELSGVAEPARMLPWGRSAGFVLDGLVIVVAADQLEVGALPERIQEHLRSQLAAADLVVLTKTDLVDDAGVAARAAVAAMAPSIPVFEGGRDRVGPGAVGRFLALGGRRPGGVTAMPAATLFDAHDVQVLPFPDQLERAGLERWLVALPVTGRVVRAKGIVATTDAGLVLVQVVGNRCEITPVPLPELEPATDLVVISLRE